MMHWCAQRLTQHWPQASESSCVAGGKRRDPRIGPGGQLRQETAQGLAPRRRPMHLPTSPNASLWPNEPIWAIGTGIAATTDDIAEMHQAIRQLLIELYGEEQGSEVRIIYGGSVKARKRCRNLCPLPEVGGALVGGASLTADSFMGIALAAGEPSDH